MTDLQHTRAWLGARPGRKAGSDDAFDRMADVVLEAMAASGGDDPNTALTVLTRVQAMIVAGMVRHAPPDEVRDICQRVGPAVQDEALRFLKSMRRDLRKPS